jgi:hypothetical protein
MDAVFEMIGGLLLLRTIRALEPSGHDHSRATIRSLAEDARQRRDQRATIAVAVRRTRAARIARKSFVSRLKRATALPFR